MLCENYREALTEAAATDSASSRELRSHLDACASCRAAFAEEQQLFAAIDGGLHAKANVEVPASLLPRVRAQLSKRAVPQSSWVPAVAAIATAAALVLVSAFVHEYRRDATRPDPPTNSVADNMAPSGMKAALPAIISSEPKKLYWNVRPTQSVKSVRVAEREDVAVLIPAGQKQAIAALLAGVRQGKIDGEVLPTEKPDEALRELRVSPLEISPIEVKPLADVSLQSPSEDEKTRH
jgi:hypothetical protein